MYEKIDRLRSWLERNKIFFDIIVVFSLTLMSLSLTLSANEIAKNQNELIKEENQPLFRFNITEDYNPENNIFDAVETLNIYNDGRPIYDFIAEPYVFLSIQHSSNNYNSDSYSEIKFAYVPITNYYNQYQYTTYPTGLLATLGRSNLLSLRDESLLLNDEETKKMLDDAYNYSTQNTVNFSNKNSLLNNKSIIFENISSDLYNYSDNKSNYDKNIFFNLYTYVHVTYLDIYGESHDEVYWVNQWGSGKLCEKDKIILTQEYNHRSLNSINSIGYLMYIPPKEIIKLLSNYSSDDSLSKDYTLPGPGSSPPF